MKEESVERRNGEGDDKYGDGDRRKLGRKNEKIEEGIIMKKSNKRRGGDGGKEENYEGEIQGNEGKDMRSKWKEERKVRKSEKKRKRVGWAMRNACIY